VRRRVTDPAGEDSKHSTKNDVRFDAFQYARAYKKGVKISFALQFLPLALNTQQPCRLVKYSPSLTVPRSPKSAWELGSRRRMKLGMR